MYHARRFLTPVRWPAWFLKFTSTTLFFDFFLTTISKNEVCRGVFDEKSIILVMLLFAKLKFPVAVILLFTGHGYALMAKPNAL